MKNKASTLQIANERFSEKNYFAALELYETFMKESPHLSHLAMSNIQLINKKISVADYKNSTAHILNRHFSKIYVVNMAHATQDKIKITHHLKSRGIDFELWIGTDGYQGEPLKLYKEYSQKPLGMLVRYADMNEREIWRKKHYIESPGAIGYIYTYSRIIQDAISNKYEKILILEDDVILDNCFEEKFAKFINSIDSDWKIVQLGASQYDWNFINDIEATLYGYYTPRRLHTCGSFAIGLDHKILKSLDEMINYFESPFDLLPLGEIYETFKKQCFVCYPNIVMPDVTSSSIRGGRNQLDHAIKMKWPIENFQFPLPKPNVGCVLTDFNAYKKAIRLRNFLDDSYNILLHYISEDGLRPIHCELNDEAELNLIKTDSIHHPSKSAPINKFSNLIEINSRTPLSIDSFIENINTQITTEISKKNSTLSPKISIIIPTYKRATGLISSATSVLDQDYQNLELIIVDDNGKDQNAGEQTESIYSKLKTAYPHREIILIKHKNNRNGAAARNTGFFASTGDYICFLDDDDLYLQGRLSKSINSLQNTPPAIGACYCGFIGWNSPKNDINRYPIGDLSKQLISLNYKSHYLHTNTITYKRSALETINGFDESFRRHQDLELNMRFFRHFQITHCKEALVQLKVNPENIDNRLLGLPFYKTKLRFLQKFSKEISNFSANDQREIYKIHASEILKFVPTSDLIATITSPDSPLFAINHLIHPSNTTNK